MTRRIALYSLQPIWQAERLCLGVSPRVGSTCRGDEVVLIGDEFWDVGGLGTYQSFIEAVNEIGPAYQLRIYKEYLGIDPPAGFAERPSLREEVKQPYRAKVRVLPRRIAVHSKADWMLALSAPLIMVLQSAAQSALLNRIRCSCTSPREGSPWYEMGSLLCCNNGGLG